MPGVAVRGREAVQAAPAGTDRQVGGPVGVRVDGSADRHHLGRAAATQRVTAFVDVVVAVDDEVDTVGVEQGHPRGPYAALGGVRVRRRIRAVVEEDDDEVDVGLVTQELQPLLQPGCLGAAAVAEVRGNLVRDVVGVEADHSDIAVDE